MTDYHSEAHMSGWLETDAEIMTDEMAEELHAMLMAATCPTGREYKVYDQTMRYWRHKTDTKHYVLTCLDGDTANVDMVNLIMGNPHPTSTPITRTTSTANSKLNTMRCCWKRQWIACMATCRLIIDFWGVTLVTHVTRKG